MRKMLVFLALGAATALPALGQGITVVSAATFTAGGPVAPESIASAFGERLAPATEAAIERPLPTALQGVSVTIVDSAGESHLCPLFFVSPEQINFLVPDVGVGEATIRIAAADTALSNEMAGQEIQTGSFDIAEVSSGIFTVTDRDWLSGFVLRVEADGTQTFLPVVERVGEEIVPVPIELSPNGDETSQSYLILYGTGNRGAGDLQGVTTRIGQSESQLDEIPTLFNGPQGDFAGLDQTNAGPLDRRLEWFGGGDRPLRISVDGNLSNLAWINVAPNPNAPVISNLDLELVTTGMERVAYGFDFADADADMIPGRATVVFEDGARFCAWEFTLSAVVQGQTEGRFRTALQTVGPGNARSVELGPIQSVELWVEDLAGHVSNTTTFVPDPPGSLPGFRQICNEVTEK